jgi:alkanesulfonate monooxygenase SsuD/methylene tetrahydromethanopterin reductase-like flavin-dependent oxidoreductase (luciferase family)
MIIQLPLRNPIDIIQDACVLNAFYPHRYRLGVGAGYNEHEFNLLEVPMTARGRLMDDGLRMMNRFRDGEIRVDLGRGVVPAMDPALGDCRPEIWVGAWTDPGVVRAARDSDGWIVDPMRKISAVETLTTRYRKACEEFGRKPRICLIREAWISDSDETALEEFAPHLVHAHSEYFPRMRGGWKDKGRSAGQPYDLTLDPWVAEMNKKEDLEFGNLIDDRILVGSALTWNRLLQDWHERIGFEELVVRLRFQSGPSPDRTLKAIQMIGANLIPRWLKSSPI